MFLIRILFLWILFTFFDYIIIEKLFKRVDKEFKKIWNYVDIYHKAYFSLFIPLLSLFLGLYDIRYIVYNFIFIFCRIEDTLYYLIQGRLPDKELPWIMPCFTRRKLFVLNAIGLLFIFVFELTGVFR